MLSIILIEFDLLPACSFPHLPRDHGTNKLGENGPEVRLSVTQIHGRINVDHLAVRAFDFAAEQVPEGKRQLQHLLHRDVDLVWSIECRFMGPYRLRTQ